MFVPILAVSEYYWICPRGCQAVSLLLHLNYLWQISDVEKRCWKAGALRQNLFKTYFIFINVYDTAGCIDRLQLVSECFNVYRKLRNTWLFPGIVPQSLLQRPIEKMSSVKVEQIILACKFHWNYLLCLFLALFTVHCNVTSVLCVTAVIDRQTWCS